MKDFKEQMTNVVERASKSFSNNLEPLYKRDLEKNKGVEQIRMEEIFKNVLMMLKQCNPFAVSQFTSDDVNFYVKHYLNKFGIEICEKVYQQKVERGNLFSLAKSPQLQNFMDACQEELNIKIDKQLTKEAMQVTNVTRTNQNPKSLKELLKQKEKK